MNLPFVITGTVRSGRHIGRQHAMPTANITPSEDTALPNGVYYSTISIAGKTYPAITDLGLRPTVSDDGRVQAETYIYDYSGDIYDMPVEVTLLEFRRPEKRFDSIDELYRTIEEDFRARRAYHGLD